MARRRNGGVSGALAGLGLGLTHASDTLLKTLMQDKLQSRYDERAAKSAEAVASRQEQAQLDAYIQKIMDEVAGGGDPASAATRISARTGQQVDPAMLEGVRPSPRRRMESSVGASIAGAKSPEEIPNDFDVASIAKTQGIGERFPGMPDFATAGMEPASGPLAELDPLAAEFGQRGAQRRSALESKPTKQVTIQDPSGAERTEFVSEYGGPITTKPDAATQGTIEATKETNKQKGILGDDALTVLTGKTKGRIEAIAEALTRQAKVATAAAVTGATERAKLQPDIVDAEVDKAHRVADGSKQPTEAERRAATNWTPLINAHAKASDLEKNGARIGTGDFTRTEYGILNRGVNPQTQQYLQSARDFVSTLGLIRSGTTVRPDERDTLVAAMYGMTGDTDSTLRQKQSSREVLLASMQAMVGRSGDEAGRILATAINNKQIPSSVLQTLQFDNEDIKKSLLANLKGVPVFDMNGNQIGVK